MMMLSRRSLWVLFASSLSVGCIDAQGSFDDFVTRSPKATGADSGTDSGSCTPPAPGEIQGNMFLAETLSLSPTLPFTYLGTIQTPAQPSGRPGIVLDRTPLAYWDRKTPVTSNVDHEGPFEVDASGHFTAVFPKQTFLAQSNPITKGDAVAQVTLSGSLCGNSGFYCGTLVAQVETLALGERTGTFAIFMLADPNAIPPNPLYYDCNQNIADPPPAK